MILADYFKMIVYFKNINYLRCICNEQSNYWNANKR